MCFGFPRAAITSLFLFLFDIFQLFPRFGHDFIRQTIVDEILLRLSRPLFLFLFLRISFLSDIVLFDLLVDGKRVRFFFRRLDSSSHFIVVVREYVSLTLSLAPFKCTAWMRVSCISYFVSCIVYCVLCLRECVHLKMCGKNVCVVKCFLCAAKKSFLSFLSFLSSRSSPSKILRFGEDTTTITTRNK